MKIQLIIMLLMILAFCLLIGCEENQQPTSVTGTLKGRLFLSHVNSAPLVNAVVSIGRQSSTTDSAGNYFLNNLPLGTQTLSINHPTIGQIDTVIQITSFTMLDFSFQIYFLGGGIFRFLLPTESLRDQSLPQFLRVRTPIAAQVTMDETCSFSTSSTFDCNIPSISQTILSGYHKFHIESPETYPLDTIVLVNHDGACGIDLNAYNFTLTSLPKPYVEFNYPLKTGTISKYQYSYSYSYANTKTTRVGIHQWTILDFTIKGQDSIYRCSVLEQDSVRNIHYSVSDTSYFEKITSEFLITVTPDSIIANWPSLCGSNELLHKLPRRYLGLSPTFIINVLPPATATYVSESGLQSFRYSYSGNHHIEEYLALTEIIK
jgi:hypothetical protein